MKRWSYIPPTDAVWKGLRKHDITSTESAALFGLSPYISKFELFHRKRRKDITEIKMNDRMLWGSRLERPIAEGIGADNGVLVRFIPEYIRIVKIRMGATFDFEIVGIDSSYRGPETLLQQMFKEYGPGLFEIKGTGYIEFRDNWTKHDDGPIEAPGHIEIQVQHQLHVADKYKWGAIGVLVSGNTPKVTARLRDVEVGESLESAVVQFWKDVRNDNAPDPTYPDDSAAVKNLQAKILDGTIYDGREDAELSRMCDDYRIGLSVEAGGKELKDAASAQIQRRLGTAERALLKEFNITRFVVADSQVEAHVRAGGPRLKITRKKAS